jgi:hypothetical protein
MASSRRSRATVAADSPAVVAIMRSDQCGWDSTMRRAAAFRSASDSGRPWVTLVRTASTKASWSSPSKKRTPISVSPRSLAARNRCMPSMTRMSPRRTMIGGRSVPTSASVLTCSRFSPACRGDPPPRSAAIATVAIGPSASNGISAPKEIARVAVGRKQPHTSTFPAPRPAHQ